MINGLNGSVNDLELLVTDIELFYASSGKHLFLIKVLTLSLILDFELHELIEVFKLKLHNAELDSSLLNLFRSRDPAIAGKMAFISAHFMVKDEWRGYVRLVFFIFLVLRRTTSRPI